LHPAEPQAKQGTERQKPPRKKTSQNNKLRTPSQNMRRQMTKVLPMAPRKINMRKRKKKKK